ncbi:DUF2750 domain-containing protein [Acinetobacter rudis]|uniref:DUF2750 domain-containing protein n=1 Tax=Acinetobacter rudis TaxID=632955 RepID=A0AAW8JA13_9GAMM|nr:DUF2750 domain-containing protein [Acinetobacter rudis]MDQ8935985.1 DUF2750 domain-containing protein [Acinetobacter rudis]MDQ8953831.1 DUF2750 domain-containing protein [Acinetobacter rudis]MDQ9018248.1 DUF2750 domain-containing protein [Acinetobacter rudis]
MKNYLKLQPVSKQFILRLSILRSMMYCGVLWGLYHDGWAIKTETNNDKVFPFWLNATQAFHYAKNNWPNYQPRKITPHDFQKSLLPTLNRFKVKPTLYGSKTAMFRLSPSQMQHFFFNQQHNQFA